MAIYSLCTTPASRSAGKSAVAMAAYRAGERLRDFLHEKFCDYKRKLGIMAKDIVFPHGVSFDRQNLWNMAEAAEKRKDARIAREVRIALPHELSPENRLNLVKEFAQEIVNKYQVAVDYAIHAPSKKGDNRNFHAHLLLTTRQITKEGFNDKSELEKSDKYLKEHGLKNGKEQITDLRNLWENLCNLSLQRNGIDEQISAKSYKARNIDKEPTIHLGPAVTAMERRGIETEKGTINRIIEKNNFLRFIEKKIKIIQKVCELLSKKIIEISNEIKREILPPSRQETILEPTPKQELIAEQSKPMAQDNREKDIKEISAKDLLKRAREQDKELEKTEERDRQVELNDLLKRKDIEKKPELKIERDKGGIDR